MIKVLIIEDEETASMRLQKLITEMLPDADIVGTLISIKDGVAWFYNNDAPDLIFADIQLSDGTSFDIFKQVSISTPIIFTTAYDAHALHAFKLNSIDYLLKPIKKEDLKNAIEKFKKIHLSRVQPVNNQLNELVAMLQKPAQYKQRFVIRLGEHMKTIQTADIAYFYTETKANFLVTKDGKRLLSNYTLDELEDLLNPKDFFRINRQFIISYPSIHEMHTYSKSRVLIKLNPLTKIETIVSTERSSAFKAWLAGE